MGSGHICDGTRIENLGGSPPLRSATDLQRHRVLRALRETPKSPSATQIRAPGWERLGFVGAVWDGLTVRRGRRLRLGAPERLSPTAIGLLRASSSSS